MTSSSACQTSPSTPKPTLLLSENCANISWMPLPNANRTLPDVLYQVLIGEEPLSEIKILGFESLVDNG